MNTIISGNVDIVVVGLLQYIKLVGGLDTGSTFYKKWSTNEEVSVDEKFNVNYIQSINVDFDGNDCLIDENESEYYKVMNYTF